MEKRVKKRVHRQIGLLQDELLEMLYQLHLDFVLHGGTALWRCYRGSRFSEDIDLYSATPVSAGFKEAFMKTVKSRGFTVSKYKDTGNVVFAKIRNQGVEVRVEINRRKAVEAVAVPYEKMNGSTLIVFTLTGKELFLEKISAYRSRHLIRDLYDVYFLASQIKSGEETKKAVEELLSDFKPPVDEANLKAIVYAGAVPSVKQMTTYLQSKRK